VKLEKEEEIEEQRKPNLMKVKVEQVSNNLNKAAGSGSESSTKIRDKKSGQESDNFEKFLKTGYLILKKEPINQQEEIKKIDSGKNQKPGKSNYAQINSTNKNNAQQGQLQTNRNVSPLKNQIMYNLKTKIDKKTFLNTSDIPAQKVEKTVSTSTNDKPAKKHYSKSIDTKEEHNNNVLSTYQNLQTKTKSPVPLQTYKK
jgi:hypothetical protein